MKSTSIRPCLSFLRGRDGGVNLSRVLSPSLAEGSAGSAGVERRTSAGRVAPSPRALSAAVTTSVTKRCSSIGRAGLCRPSRRPPSTPPARPVRSANGRTERCARSVPANGSSLRRFAQANPINAAPRVVMSTRAPCGDAGGAVRPAQASRCGSTRNHAFGLAVPTILATADVRPDLSSRNDARVTARRLPERSPGARKVLWRRWFVLVTEGESPPSLGRVSSRFGKQPHHVATRRFARASMTRASEEIPDPPRVWPKKPHRRRPWSSEARGAP